MLTIDPRDTLVLAHEHARRLRDEAVARSDRPLTGTTRRALAASLRRAANRLDPVAPRAARPQLSAAR